MRFPNTERMNSWPVVSWSTTSLYTGIVSSFMDQPPPTNSSCATPRHAVGDREVTMGSQIRRESGGGDAATSTSTAHQRRQEGRVERAPESVCARTCIRVCARMYVSVCACVCVCGWACAREVRRTERRGVPVPTPRRPSSCHGTRASASPTTSRARWSPPTRTAATGSPRGCPPPS